MAELWQIAVTITCVIFSGLFSGLTLGLMSISLIDLHILLESGTPEQIHYARKLIPVRRHTNYLLCTLLIGNTAVNSCLSIVSSKIFGGFLGFTCSTIAILYFGEIIPQAICHRFGLIVGANLLPIIKIAMVFSAPLAWPTSLALDWFLGGEGLDLYNKRELQSLVRIHGLGGAYTDVDDDSSEGDIEMGWKKKNKKKNGNFSLSSSGNGNLNMLSNGSIATFLQEDPAMTAAQVDTLNGNLHTPLANSDDDHNHDNDSDSGDHMESSSDEEEGEDEDEDGKCNSSNTRNHDIEKGVCHVVHIENNNNNNNNNNKSKKNQDDSSRSLSSSSSSSSTSSSFSLSASSSSTGSSSDNNERKSGRKRKTEKGKRFRLKFFRKRRNSSSSSSFSSSSSSSRLSRSSNRKNDRTKATPITKDEVKILQSTLDFSNKTVEHVMTKLEDVFMLELNDVLNFNTIRMIFQSGHSRIPVYEEQPDNIVGHIFTKDLILLGPDEEMPIRAILEFFDRRLLSVYYDTNLSKMLKVFKKGVHHMAIVQKSVPISHNHNGNENGEEAIEYVNVGDGGKRLETVGIITLEDVIEELIGDEILDETDVYFENKNRKRVKRLRSINPNMLRLFDNRNRKEEKLDEQEIVMVEKFLREHVEEFDSHHISSKQVLLNLLEEAVVLSFRSNDHHHDHQYHHSCNVAQSSTVQGESGDCVVAENSTSVKDFSRQEEHVEKEEIQPIQAFHNNNNPIIYVNHVVTTDAYLVLSGQVSLSYETKDERKLVGPWSMLGSRALSSDIFAPDFTASIVGRPTRLLKISKRLYRSKTRSKSRCSSYTSSNHGNGENGSLA